MKKFIKKANRGILLGSIIIFFLVIYIITDNILFRSQQENVSQTVTSYVSDYLNALSENDTDKLKSVISSYWTYVPTYSSLMIHENKEEKLEELSYEIPDSKRGSFFLHQEPDLKISVSKCGPGYAQAKISGTYSLGIDRESSITLPFSSDYISISEPSYVQYNMEGYVYLHYEDGKWLISQSDVFLLPDNITPQGDN